MPDLQCERPPVAELDLLQGLPETVCQSVISAAIHREVPVGYEIFRAGEPRVSVSLLVHGLAKVSDSDVDGNETLLWLSAPGQFIGSLNLIPGAIHYASAVAIQPCEMLTWSLAVFETILERFASVAHNVQKVMAQQAAELCGRICEISTLPVPVCLARTLVRIVDQMRTRSDNPLEIPLTQETLAQMTASTVYNVNHQLASWERQGLVTRRRRLVIILDLVGLRKLSRSIR